jgi:hypothetical protein
MWREGKSPARMTPVHHGRKAIMIFLAEGTITTMPAAAHDCERNALADPYRGLAAPRQSR